MASTDSFSVEESLSLMMIQYADIQSISYTMAREVGFFWNNLQFLILFLFYPT